MFPFIVFLAITIYTDSNIYMTKYCSRNAIASKNTEKTNVMQSVDLNRL